MTKKAQTMKLAFLDLAQAREAAEVMRSHELSTSTSEDTFPA